LTANYKKWLVQDIIGAKIEETRERRIKKAIEKLEAQEKYHD
jgi:hypothetical protein